LQVKSYLINIFLDYSLVAVVIKEKALAAVKRNQVSGVKKSKCKIKRSKKTKNMENSMMKFDFLDIFN